MPEWTASELHGRRIRIYGKIDNVIGHRLMVSDVETEQKISNITKIELTLLPEELITAKVTLVHIGEMEEMEDGSSHANVSEETAETSQVDVSLTAIIDEVQEEAAP